MFFNEVNNILKLYFFQFFSHHYTPNYIYTQIHVSTLPFHKFVINNFQRLNFTSWAKPGGVSQAEPNDAGLCNADRQTLIVIPAGSVTDRRKPKDKDG